MLPTPDPSPRGTTIVVRGAPGSCNINTSQGQIGPGGSTLAHNASINELIQNSTTCSEVADRDVKSCGSLPRLIDVIGAHHAADATPIITKEAYHVYGVSPFAVEYNLNPVLFSPFLHLGDINQPIKRHRRRSPSLYSKQVEGFCLDDWWDTPFESMTSVADSGYDSNMDYTFNNSATSEPTHLRCASTGLDCTADHVFAEGSKGATSTLSHLSCPAQEPETACEMNSGEKQQVVFTIKDQDH
ncbi:hypothetical protein EK21DRAFT_93946 [Setomelanomma holmii]|uniref:Uncharacterized protein n=1 Tax=Setomelanomma holmii TaxID=210430 RepID=A0A9P4LFM6_9PLEO|nr:hypothetical protein EK21DRAFT_93946 [Setomelanomma holmii]